MRLVGFNNDFLSFLPEDSRKPTSREKSDKAATKGVFQSDCTMDIIM